MIVRYTAAAATYCYDTFNEDTGSASNSYGGYQYDKETGLYYLDGRMYDPKIARFMQEDTYSGDPNDPLSLNLYTYSHNEPIMYTDPDGHKEGDWWDPRTWAVDAGKAANYVSDESSDAWDVVKSEADRRWENVKAKTSDEYEAVKNWAKGKQENFNTNSQNLWNGIKAGVNHPKDALVGLGSSVLNGGLETAKVAVTALAGMSGQQYANAAWGDLSNTIDQTNKNIENNVVSNYNAYSSYRTIGDAGQMAWGAEGLIGDTRNILNGFNDFQRSSGAFEYAGTGFNTLDISPEESSPSNIREAEDKARNRNSKRKCSTTIQIWKSIYRRGKTVVHKQHGQSSGTLTARQQKVLNLIVDVVKDINKEIQAHNNGTGTNGTISQLENMLNELNKMKLIMNPNTFIPYYPRTIVDSWDFNSELAKKLLDIADEYSKLKV